MAWNNNIITSIFGRRVGLQPMSTVQNGGGKPAEFLVGPSDFRVGVTTAESTGTNLLPYGLSFVAGSSAASSSVFTLDPPIPGVRKLLYFPSTGDKNVYLKSANSETFKSTVGSSFTTIQSTAGGLLELIGVTTAIWAAFGLTSGTSSQASGFALTTTT